MIRVVKGWLERRRKKKYRKEYARGFNYCAREHFIRHRPLEELHAEAVSRPSNPFSRGVIVGVVLFRTRGVSNG